MLRGIEVEVNVKYNEVKSHIEAKKTIYTGMIDEFFDFQFGSPEYRSLHFVHLYKDCYNYQGCAVINYPGLDVPYTRSIEHKHFALDTTSPTTIVTYEFPVPYKEGLIPYYPVGNSRDVKIYDKYLTLASQMSNIVFAGRLGSYQYYDMDDTIDHALQLADKELQ
jgi:UDP-galactopyranose mutase